MNSTSGSDSSVPTLSLILMAVMFRPWYDVPITRWLAMDGLAETIELISLVISA